MQFISSWLQKGIRMKRFNLNHKLWVLGSMKWLGVASLLACAFGGSNRALASQSIARIWDERALSAIRADTPHPPAQARNLFSLSVCMYDAWAAYDSVAVGYVYHGKHSSTNLLAARNEAISYAAYRMLKERHVYSKTASNTLVLDDAQMAALGYQTNYFSTTNGTAADV